MEAFKETWYFIVFRRLIKGKLALLGLVIFLVVILVSLLAPWISRMTRTRPTLRN